MKRCTRCLIPDSRPDTAFVDGVCSACISYANRPTIDWVARGANLTQLLDRFHGECIVPSSGGKDSSAQVLALQELGAKVTVVTATTCYLTENGRANIDNLARYASTIEVTPNRTVRAKLNRLGLRLVGDISWSEHVAIFTIPFNVARALGRDKLIFFGENPQNQYGGPLHSGEADQMTARWRSEFGGFLGLRPDDMVGKEGITERDMAAYQIQYQPLEPGRPEAHFLGQYLPWDSHRNATRAAEAGMHYSLPTPANWWPWENLDNAMTGLHDWFMYLKFGYGRGCAQASVDVRAGNIWRDGNLVHRDAALAWVLENDGRFPQVYAGVPYAAVLDRIGITEAELSEIAHKFTTFELFNPESTLQPDGWSRLTLKEESP